VKQCDDGYPSCRQAETTGKWCEKDCLAFKQKITLINIDCLEYMAGLPDKAFELAIVDPPYGIGADKEKYTPENSTWTNKTKKGYVTKHWDKAVPDDLYFKELFRISKNQIVWGANYFGLIGGYIFWDKKETMPTYSKGELAWTSLFNRVDLFEMLWSGYKKEVNEIRIHPTQKPVKLYEWLLTNYAKPGDRILDTHLGSGSSAIAAHNLGFDFVGMELDPDYYAAAVKRFEQHKAQARLFDCDDYQQTERDYQQDSLL
jgi:site-specific DNA-methyltransferase (adenine-specific)